MTERLRADLTLLLVAAIWGTAFVAQRVAALQGAVFLFNGSRFLLAALILLPFARWPWGFGRREWLAVLAAGAALFLASAFQQAGIQFTSAGNAGFITSLYIVLVPVLLRLFWRQRQGSWAWVAVLVAGVGAFLLSTNGRFAFHPGDALMVACAVFFALHVITVDRLGGRIDSLRFAIGQYVFAGLLNLLLGLVLEDPVVQSWPPVLGSLVYTAVFSIGIGYTLQVVGQKHTPPTDAALILGLESVFAVLGGWLVLNESLLPVQLLGCALIMIAVIMAQLRPGRAPQN